MTGRPSESHTVDLAILQKGLSVQEASQRLTSVPLGLPGHAGIRRTIEAVIRPRIQVQLDRYSDAAQSIRIGQVFFKEEIETAYRNVGWRQARHIRRARGRRIRRDTSRTRLLAEQRTPAKIIVLLRPDEIRRRKDAGPSAPPSGRRSSARSGAERRL